MAGLSGLCPQRRFTKAGDSDVFRAMGQPLLSAREASRQAWYGRCSEGSKADFHKPDVDFRYSWWPSTNSVVRAFLVLVGIFMLTTATLVYGSGVLLIRANDLGRQCTSFRPRAARHDTRVVKFALVTCSDGSKSVPQRSFEGLMELVTPNKRSYAERHGYQFIDASEVLNKERPPSWSKILAVKKHLPDYDWIFWNDADSVVTNPLIALEDIIDSIVGDVNFEDMPDFIVTEDVTGVNAGMFFFRNSEWSRVFLDKWWNQTSFVGPFGQSKSGDNYALKHLIKNMPAEERQRHVRIPRMQCIFNSNLWRPSWRSSQRLMTLTRSVWQGVYAKGDFMVHLAGLNDKKKWVKKVLKDIEEQSANRIGPIGPDSAFYRRAGAPWRRRLCAKS